MKHRCVECGFLAARNINNRALDEVEQNVRKTGKPTLVRGLQDQAQGWNARTPRDEELLICSKQKRDLINEAQDNPNNELTVIQDEKECDSFITWKQGSNPKEHQDMLDEQWKIEYRAKLDKEDKEWREQRITEDRNWRAKQESKNRQFLVIAAIVGAVITVVAGWFFTWLSKGG